MFKRCWESFQFRWLKMQWIYAIFSILITIFSQHLKLKRHNRSHIVNVRLSQNFWLLDKHQKYRKTDDFNWWHKRGRKFLEPWTRVWLGSYILLTLWLQQCLNYSKPTEKIQFPGEIFSLCILIAKRWPDSQFFKLVKNIWCWNKTVLGFQTLLSMSPIMIGLNDLISWWSFQELIMRLTKIIWSSWGYII